VTYTTTDARQGLLDTVASAIERLGFALAALGEAYEQLDEPTGDRLERDLFGPVQLAYGRAQRMYSAFAARYELGTRAFAPAPAAAPSTGAYGLIDNAAQAVNDADAIIVELQDSLAPVEVGDPELRDGLREVRELLAPLGDRARELVRTLGR
jgi:hypothetical protein